MQISKYSDDQLYYMFCDWGEYYNRLDAGINTRKPDHPFTFDELTDELILRDNLKVESVE